MEYPNYKNKYDKIENEIKELFKEVGEDKEKKYKIYKKESEEILELAKSMERNNDYSRTGKLYRFYIYLMSESFSSSNSSKNANWRLIKKILYHLDEYLKRDFYNFDIQLAYLSLVTLNYFYESEYERCKELLKDSIYKNYANLYLAMEAKHFFCEGIIEEEELQKLETYKERYIADYGDKIYDKVYEETKREIEERNLRRDW